MNPVCRQLIGATDRLIGDGRNFAMAHVLPNALQVPAIKKLENKHIVLASNSPRRKEIFQTILVGAP
jgi:hypothetical protein